VEALIFHLWAGVLLLAGGTVSLNGISTGRLGTLAVGVGIMLILIVPVLP